MNHPSCTDEESYGLKEGGIEFCPRSLLSPTSILVTSEKAFLSSFISFCSVIGGPREFLGSRFADYLLRHSSPGWRACCSEFHIITIHVLGVCVCVFDFFHIRERCSSFSMLVFCLQSGAETRAHESQANSYLFLGSFSQRIICITP